MAHGLYKQLARRANSYRVLCDKAFGITSNPQYDGYQSKLASMVHNFFFDKKYGSRIKTCQLYLSSYT